MLLVPRSVLRAPCGLLRRGLRLLPVGYRPPKPLGMNRCPKFAPAPGDMRLRLREGDDDDRIGVALPFGEACEFRVL